MSGAALHIRLVLRGPAASEPSPRGDEIGIHAITGLLQSKSEQCETLGIYFEKRAVFALVADKLSSHQFSQLTQLALINIEPVWGAERSDDLQPTPEFLKLGGPAIRHLRLVGFGLSIRNKGEFRHITILVLGDLDKITAPTVDELYGVLREATWLAGLSIGIWDRAGE